MKRRDDPKQLKIDWTSQPPPAASHEAHDDCSAPTESMMDTPGPLVQCLPWDFTTTFPQPTDDAIDTGVVDESDCEPENLKSMHECYASQCLGTLKALDTIMDARRRGVDPGTGKKPRNKASRERLSKYLGEEPARLDRQFNVLIETYENAFGPDAAEAFRKFLRARHAGIDVEIEGKSSLATPNPIPVPQPRRLSSVLPVPQPLQSSVAAGVFGRDEKAEPIRPEADEIRAITTQHAERMVTMEEPNFRSAVQKCAKDFGQSAAEQLERHVRRQMARL